MLWEQRMNVGRTSGSGNVPDVQTPRCDNCGRGLRLAGDVAASGELCATCRREVTDAQRCSCGADVFVINHRFGLHYDENDPSQLCPQSHTLTRDGWHELIIDALVDESLMLTYQPQSAVSKHEDATACFVDTFFDRWTKLVNNELPKFGFDPKQWVDFTNDPQSAIEPKVSRQPKHTATG
jgi:hypothetical protein